jgi:hypothetical protein
MRLENRSALTPALSPRRDSPGRNARLASMNPEDNGTEDSTSLPSPSPRPSPLGRGRAIDGASWNLTPKTKACGGGEFPLSRGERAGARGKEAFSGEWLRQQEVHGQG